MKRNITSEAEFVYSVYNTKHHRVLTPRIQEIVYPTECRYVDNRFVSPAGQWFKKAN